MRCRLCVAVVGMVGGLLGCGSSGSSPPKGGVLVDAAADSTSHASSRADSGASGRDGGGAPSDGRAQDAGREATVDAGFCGSTAPSDGIFVSPAASGSGSCGTKADPCPDIPAGLAAAASGGASVLYLASGVYAPFTVVDGISVVGGWDASWKQTCSPANTQIVGALAGPVAATVLGQNLTKGLTLAELTVQNNAVAAPSQSLYGVFLSYATTQSVPLVTLTDVVVGVQQVDGGVVVAGAGASGTTPPPPDGGPNDAGGCPTSDAAGAPGSAGLPGAAATASSAGLTAAPPGSATGQGQAGNPGSQGDAGLQGCGSTEVCTAVFSVGAVGGTRCIIMDPSQCVPGGAGGCGGLGGAGGAVGGGGGSSVAIFVWGGVTVAMVNGAAVSGGGGPGGSGAPGGEGGAGEPGHVAAAALFPNPESCTLVLTNPVSCTPNYFTPPQYSTVNPADGGTGQPGTPGGQGGRGGGGSGGDSYAYYVGGGATMNVSPATVLSTGSPGSGGAPNGVTGHGGPCNAPPCGGGS
jgi:hypothetical protein